MKLYRFEIKRANKSSRVATCIIHAKTIDVIYIKRFLQKAYIYDVPNS